MGGFNINFVFNSETFKMRIVINDVYKLSINLAMLMSQIMTFIPYNEPKTVPTKVVWYNILSLVPPFKCIGIPSS